MNRVEADLARAETRFGSMDQEDRRRIHDVPASIRIVHHQQNSQTETVLSMIRPGLHRLRNLFHASSEREQHPRW